MVNRIFEYPQTAVDFLPFLRSFHEQSRRSATWQKLRLVLVY
ncbi:MAG TPA: AAA-like domain-containing protein [Coleofasciculaceae cyanobacterium]